MPFPVKAFCGSLKRHWEFIKSPEPIGERAMGFRTAQADNITMLGGGYYSADPKGYAMDYVHCYLVIRKV